MRRSSRSATSFYVQDTWRATPKLTLNYGLRYELYFPEAINTTGQGAVMNLNTGYLQVAGVGGVASNMNFSLAKNAYNPRIGIAYQVTEKTVVRAGYGRSFDIGVFGSLFGHVATQNLPVLANQQINSTGGAKSRAFSLATGPVTLHGGDSPRQWVAAFSWLLGQLQGASDDGSAAND